ncbi:MAG: hypothetical protein ACXVEE_12190 [Polyangiales bacterium]
MRRALLLIVFVGCGSPQTAPPAPAPPAPTGEMPKAPPPTGAPATVSTIAPAPAPTASAKPPGEKLVCIPKSAAPFPLAHVALEGKEVVACYRLDMHEVAGTGYPCIKVDPRAKTFATAPSWFPGTPVPSTKAWTVKTTEKEVTVCKSGTNDCKTVKPGFTQPKGVGNADSLLVADVSPDGSKLFVIEVTSAKMPVSTFGDTFDVATGKRTSRIPLKLLEDPSDYWQIAWVGKRVQVTTHRCCGPAGSSALVDPQSGASSSLGDPNMFVHVKGDKFLLGTENSTSTKVSIVSVDEGKILKDLTGLAAKGFDEPELNVLDAVVLPDGAAAVVHANPPGVALVDVDAMTMTPSLPIPVCTW